MNLIYIEALLRKVAGLFVSLSDFNRKFLSALGATDCMVAFVSFNSQGSFAVAAFNITVGFTVSEFILMTNYKVHNRVPYITVNSVFF